VEQISTDFIGRKIRKRGLRKRNQIGRKKEVRAKLHVMQKGGKVKAKRMHEL
jgi:hypothetical protein